MKKVFVNFTVSVIVVVLGGKNKLERLEKNCAN